MIFILDFNFRNSKLRILKIPNKEINFKKRVANQPIPEIPLNLKISPRDGWAMINLKNSKNPTTKSRRTEKSYSKRRQLAQTIKTKLDLRFNLFLLNKNN